MKKFTSILLILTMLSSAAFMAACSGSDKPESENASAGDSQTPVTEEAETPAEETEAPAEETEAPKEETEAPTEETEAPAEETEEDTGFGYLVDQMELMHYRTFVCPYTDGNGEIGGWTAGGYFDPDDDEMAEFVSKNPEWYKDTALMAGWDEAEGPFGDCINEAFAADTDFINDKVNTNGLMVYRTFNVDNLADDTLYELYCFYDNTVYIYINGELFFYNDANCGNGDWNGSLELIKCNTDPEKDLGDFLVSGENYIAISIKNCWGGRELDYYITYQEGSTKRNIDYFTRGSEWHYSVFNCPYTDGEGNIDGSASGGFFDEATDDMAKFIAENPNFMTDTALLSSWPTAEGAFGNIMNDIGWTGSVHGLILYKSFTIDNLEEALSADRLVWDCAYDNAIHTYHNGVEVYTDDGECVNPDWNEGEWVLDAAQMAEVLKEGENYFVVTIKDAWGGRNFDAGFNAQWD